MNALQLVRTSCCGMGAAILLSVAAAPAPAATLFAEWTFEESMPDSAGPHAPEVGAGAAFVVHQGASQSSSPTGNGSEHSFSSTSWAVGDYYQFNCPLGVRGEVVLFRFDMASNAAEPPVFSLQRSIDGGTFNTIRSNIKPSDAPPNIPWNSSARRLAYSFTAASFSVTVPRPVSYRLLCYDVPFPLDPSVNVRLDNVSIIAVPEPASGLLAACAALFGAAAMRRRG